MSNPSSPAQGVMPGGKGLFLPLFKGQEGRHDCGDSQHENEDLFETHRSYSYI
jgi:hypothetical protein